MENLICDSYLQSYYDNYLRALIPMLNQFPFAQGGEGNAYFIDDQFVVKEFLYNQTDDLRHFFEKYCVEMQNFSLLGYNVPKIYSWKRVVQEPNPIKEILFDNSSFYGDYKFYILEERINAPLSLYCGSVEKSFAVASKFCSKREFENAIKNPSHHPSLFKEIYSEYCKDCISANQYILDMSDSDLQKFVTDVYNMYLDAKYSRPDLYYGNILKTNGGLCLIDNFLELREGSLRNSPNKINAQNFIITELMSLFEDYGNSTNLANIKKGNNLINSAEFDKLRETSKRLCKASILKMISAINKSLDNPKVSNKSKYYYILHSLKYAIGREDTIEVLREINTNGI
jgi:hypothetical protein